MRDRATDAMTAVAATVVTVTVVTAIDPATRHVVASMTAMTVIAAIARRHVAIVIHHHTIDAHRVAIIAMIAVIVIAMATALAIAHVTAAVVVSDSGVDHEHRMRAAHDRQWRATTRQSKSDENKRRQ